MSMKLSPLAEALNTDLNANGGATLRMLSRRGKAMYFPSKGILGQSAEAKTAKINATIGTAFEEDCSPLTLKSVEASLNLPNTSFLYQPSFGNPKLRETWHKLIGEKNPSLGATAYSLPVVTAALTHGLSVAGYLFANEGDQIILPDMYWDNYDLVFGEAYGAELVTYNTFKNGGYDVDALAAALAAGPKGKKIVLLNFPNNPTGYTCTDSEAVQIADVLKKSAEAGNDVVVLLDDAYFGLVYEKGVFLESLFAKLATAHPNLLAVKLDGPTKEDYVWGFRVGFVTFAFQGATAAQLKALENKAAGAVRASISNAPSISQEILLKAYTSSDYPTQKAEKYNTLQKRYTKIRAILSAHPEYAQSFEAMPFNSGYFMCVKPIGVDAEALRQKLLKDYATGTIMLSGLIRLAFSAVPLAQLDDLFANIHAAVSALKG